jgi:hypothetical protein
MRGTNLANTCNSVSETVIDGSGNIAASSTGTTRVTKATSSYLPAGEAETNLATDFSGNEREEYGTTSGACSPLIMNDGIPDTTMPTMENAKGKDYSIGPGAKKRLRSDSVYQVSIKSPIREEVPETKKLRIDTGNRRSGDQRENRRKETAHLAMHGTANNSENAMTRAESNVPTDVCKFTFQLRIGQYMFLVLVTFLNPLSQDKAEKDYRLTL